MRRQNYASISADTNVLAAMPVPHPIFRAPDAMTDSNLDTLHTEAAVYRRLRDHLMQQRPDAQNIDLMILAGFCRNCLSDWYREASESRGITMTKDESREAVYGEPFAEWKAKHQREATPEQVAAFEARRSDTGA